MLPKADTPAGQSNRPLAEWTRAYIAAGMPVFVRPPQGAAYANCPECADSSPQHAATCRHLLCHGQLAATLDPHVADAMLNAKPDSVIGIATGAALADGGHLIVIDIDPRNGGDTWLRRELDHGNLGVTLAATSNSGGLHLYYRTRANLGSGNSRLAPGVDHKCANGNVSAAPTATRRWLLLHHHPKIDRLVTGDPRDCACNYCHTFRAMPLTLDEWTLAPIATLPEHIEQQLLALTRINQPLAAHPLDVVRRRSGRGFDVYSAINVMQQQSVGTRNDTLNALAWRYGRTVAEGQANCEPEILEALTAAAIASGLDATEAHRTAVKSFDSGVRGGRHTL